MNLNYYYKIILLTIITNMISLVNFKEYQKFIREHPNYDFIPKELKKNWTCVSKKGVNPRKSYWEIKRDDLISSGKLPKDSKFVNVARYLHPTKIHKCEICNQDLSIYYEYPTKNTWKFLKREFNVIKSEENKNCTIFELYDIIEDINKDVKFTKYFKKSMIELKTDVRNDKYTGRKLSPGVMANPPDRLEGFHSYNSICGCRKSKDKGRSDENMKSYTRDRRAYEMMSDGNVLLANLLMGKLNKITKRCFMCGKENAMSADHIGPISLGFIHDTNNFQACCSSCNSSKNNRLTQRDIEIIKSKEEHSSMISWWAEDCWNSNKNSDVSQIQSALDRNAKKMLIIIDWMKENKKEVLTEFIENNYLKHDKSYKIENINIDSQGTITYEYSSSISTKKTKETQKQRTIEILTTKCDKKNRNIKITLTENEKNYLNQINDISTFNSMICKVLQGF